MCSWKRQTQRVGRAAIRRILSPSTLLVSLLLTAMLAIGCQEQTRYRVLSLFFDGVPVPAGMEEEDPATAKITGPWGVQLDPDDPLAQKILAARAKSGAARVDEELEDQYLHSPYRNRNRQCSECHTGASFQAAVSATTCSKCHKEHYNLPADDWVHGPVAQGDCRMCHKPHLSKYRGLLIAEQSELCLGCHDDARLLGRSYHSEIQAKRCTDCHDPHSAGNRLLLVDSNSMARKLRVKTLPSKHDTEWDKDTCEQCHSTERSNRVVRDVDRICLSCHEDIQTEARARKFHEPVGEGKCTSCHMAHKSSRPYLIKGDARDDPKAEEICLGCHELKEIQTDKHPPIVRGDCLLCHRGHTAGRRHLLRATADAPGVPAAILPAQGEPQVGGAQ